MGSRIGQLLVPARGIVGSGLVYGNEGHAGTKKPRAISAGAASLIGYNGIYGKPFFRSRAEPIGTPRNYAKRQTR